MAGKLMSKLSQGALVAMAGYELGAKTGEVVRVADVQPVEPTEQFLNGKETFIICIIATVVMLLILMFKAFKCATKVLKAVETSNDE